MEGGIKQMNANIPTHVGTRPGTESIERAQASISELNHQVISDQALGEEHDTSDEILEIAKNEGFEAALIKLSSDEEIEEEELLDEELNQMSAKEKASIEDNNEDGKELDIKKDDNKEERPSDDALEGLSSRINELSTQIDEAKEKIASLDSNSISKEAFVELALIFAEINKEENEEEKIDLFDLLVKAMTRIMVEIASDGTQQNQKEGAGMTQKRTGKKRSIADIRESLYKKGLLNRPSTEVKAA